MVGFKNCCRIFELWLALSFVDKRRITVSIMTVTYNNNCDLQEPFLGILRIQKISRVKVVRN